MVLGFTKELELLIMCLLGEVGDGEKFIVESNDFFFFPVFEFEGEIVQYLIWRRNIYCLTQILHSNLPKLFIESSPSHLFFDRFFYEGTS